MKVREVRHTRIVELRNMALRGATLDELKARCVKLNISKPTMNSYLNEVITSLQKAAKKDVPVL